MKIPVLAGVYVDGSPAVRVAYPVNMIPVPGQDGIDEGYLRPAEGIETFTTGQGVDRGAIVWDGDHYRVSGTKLISISSAGAVTVIDDVPGTGPVRLDFSFDLLGIAADGDLYYWDGSNLTKVTDPDVGTVNDMVWVDGYFMVTDGAYVAVSDLGTPTSFNPLKYGSTDSPDPIQCLLKVQNEVHVVSRHMIDVFQNIGGTGFPFQRVQSAHIPRGAIGRRAACVFAETVAFVGGDRNEAPGIYLGRNAQTVKISTREVDNLLLEYTEAQLATTLLETVVNRGSQFLFVHLPDRTLVYESTASAAAKSPVWCVLTTSLDGFAQYRAQNIVRVDDTWIVGDPLTSAIGRWTTDDSQHWGADVRWEFSTPMLRAGGKNAIMRSLELVALTGAVPFGVDPMVSTSYSVDGRTWSQSRAIRSGKRGDATKRLVWMQQGMWRNWRVQRFQGDSGSRLSALQIEAQVEPLAN
ncbi:MAG: packaged DNA stabilization protein [Elusimicrobiota bacterium]|jgi:hypothetical protein